MRCAFIMKVCGAWSTFTATMPIAGDSRSCAASTCALCASHAAIRGCSIWTFDEEIDVPGVPIEVVDTVGAGDAFTAGLLTQMFEGKSLAQAARFANAFGALVASDLAARPASNVPRWRHCVEPRLETAKA